MKRIRLMLAVVFVALGGNSVLLADIDIPAIGGTWGQYVYSSNPRGYIKGWGGWQGSCPIWINRGGYELDISDTPKWMLVRYTVSENYTINDREAVISFNYYESFKDGITEKSIKVVQYGSVNLSINPTKVGFQGGNINLAIESNASYWDVSTSSSWLYSAINEGHQSLTFNLKVDDNILNKDRSSTVKVSNKSQKVSQEGQLDYTGTPSAVTSGVKVRYGIYDEGIEELFVDDEKVFSSEGRGEFTWQPQNLESWA